MKMKRMIRAALLLALCLALSGCRTRTEVQAPAGGDRESGQAEQFIAAEAGAEADKQEKNGEAGEQTKENPESSRKEYDETRPAEIVPGTERTLHSEGEGEGRPASGEDTDQPAAKVNDSAEETATQSVAAETAEQAGVSEEAEEADSAMRYYSVLLQERAGSLFECQRLNVYWETREDHRTVFRTSQEHSLILDAGAYDVSSRLLEENLHVDDGWILRKNPDLVVKVTGRSVLGTGVSSTEAAGRIYEGLLARDGWAAMSAVRDRRILLLSEEVLETPYLQLAAMLMIAKTASPDLYADVNIDSALAMLGEETTGSAPYGIYYYNGQGGF